ncbi:MAG: hypothetical protein U9N59_15455 [Campylobacterota bacterium]|nr:hypothetical protein [Campylobacterota bacterium]
MEILKYIKKNYNYIVIFTNLDNDPTGSIKENMCLENNGYTCCWVIANSRKIEKILLYIRENNINKIYQADYNYRENIEGRRYKVYYNNLEFVDNTKFHWKEFTNTQSPIRYINKII